MNNIVEAGRAILEKEVSKTSAALKSVSGVGSGHAGLTPDNIKASREYRTARRNYDLAFNALRNFNAKYKP